VVETAEIRGIRGRLAAAGTRRQLGLVALAVVFVCATWSGLAAGTPSCLTVPESIPQNQLLLTGGSTTARVGAVLYVVLVEPEMPATPEMYVRPDYPHGFPWQAPISVDRAVLKRVRLCPSRTASTLPLTVTGFRAQAAGLTTISARLTARWRAVSRVLRPFRATVIVRG
jgi:hypothetical protein